MEFRQDEPKAKADSSRKLDSRSATLSEQDRRTALKKLGKYAAYAAPALLAMTSGAKAQAFSGPSF